MERKVAIRGFVMTSNKEIGLTLWGEVADRVFNYEIGVFAGDGQKNRIRRAVVFLQTFALTTVGDTDQSGHQEIKPACCKRGTCKRPWTCSIDSVCC